jgi:excisionase family DNA binding protein
MLRPTNSIVSDGGMLCVAQRPRSTRNWQWFADEASVSWNAKQAAEYLHLRPRTVKLMASRRLIPAMKLGKSWVFDETTLREWLQSGTRENIRSCPSESGKIRRIGKLDSKSLASKLDAALERATDEPRKSSRNDSEEIHGDRSNSDNNTGPGQTL